MSFATRSSFGTFTLTPCRFCRRTSNNIIQKSLAFGRQQSGTVVIGGLGRSIERFDLADSVGFRLGLRMKALHRGHLVENLAAQSMTDLAERGSLGVRELQPSLQLGLQDAIFGGQIFDARQQLLVHHPRGEGQNARPIHSSSAPADSRLIALKNRSQRPPSRLRREWTIHRLFYSFNFLTIRAVCT